MDGICLCWHRSKVLVESAYSPAEIDRRMNTRIETQNIVAQVAMCVHCWPTKFPLLADDTFPREYMLYLAQSVL